MKIVVNGEIKQIPGSMDLARLIEFLSMPTERVAVELNKGVVPRADWAEVTVKDEDRIEIVHFVGGG